MDRELQAEFPDVNVIWIKINFMIHSRGQALQMDEVAGSFQLQCRPPRE